MAGERQTYLLKVTKEAQEYRIELRQNGEQPKYFYTLEDLTRYLKAQFPLEEEGPQGR